MVVDMVRPLRRTIDSHCNVYDASSYRRKRTIYLVYYLCTHHARPNLTTYPGYLFICVFTHTYYLVRAYCTYVGRDNLDAASPS